MTRIDNTRLSFLYHLGNYLRTLEHHTAFHILSPDCHELHRFHDQVTEEMIEVMLYLSDLGLRFLWERRGEVLPHHFPSIASHLI